ncbi:MAG: serine/threonine-protein kinase [Cyanobacteria bacterium J06632_22]
MPAPAQLIGQTLKEQYFLQSLLGEHDGRQTYLAEDQQAQPVVVKLFLFGPGATWDAFKLFQREVATLQALNHPLIPDYIDAFETDTELGKGFALVQAYVPHKSLRNWVEAGRQFTEADVVHVGTEMLNILKDLHGLQPPIIHRDIKPSNILLGDRSGHDTGQVFLVDFGSVQVVNPGGGTRTVVGTYGYMPMEQFGGRAVAASDLYSLGATLIYLASGKHPADLPQNNLRIDFTNQVSLSQPMVNWLTALTHPDPAQRPQDAATALEQLQSVHSNAHADSAIAAFPNIDIQTAADHVDITLPRSSVYTTKTIIFNYRRHEILGEALGFIALFYVVAAPLALVAALLGFPAGLRLWFGMFWLWYPILMGLFWMVGAGINRLRQLGVRRYRLRLETQDGKPYTSLIGLFKRKNRDTAITMAVPTCGIYDIYRRGYKFTLMYRDRNHDRSSHSYHFSFLISRSQLKPLVAALQAWQPSFRVRKAFHVKPGAND